MLADLNSVNTSQLLTNILTIIATGGTIFYYIKRSFDRAIDNRVTPELRNIHQRIDNHMAEEESSLDRIEKNHRKVLKKIKRIETRGQRIRRDDYAKAGGVDPHQPTR